jgi:hypothetical protein
VSASVDWDRLADYAAGLLDGTPDAEQIAHLVQTDPGWAHAHEQLRAVDRLVVADLAALASTPEPMPAEVAARLEAALAAEEHAGSRTVVSLDARRRRRHWAVAAGAIAAGVAALAFIGPQVLGGGSAHEDLATSDAGGNGTGESVVAPAAPQESGLIVTASGVDYGRGSQFRANDQGKVSEFDEQPRSNAEGTPPRSARLTVPPELARLNTAETRQDCLTAIVGQYGGRPLSVDYARFEGKPALMVVLADAGNRPARMVAAGPDCGLGGDAKVLYAAPVE